jgi:hypothetical protein
LTVAALAEQKEALWEGLKTGDWHHAALVLAVLHRATTSGYSLLELPPGALGVVAGRWESGHDVEWTAKAFTTRTRVGYAWGTVFPKFGLDAAMSICVKWSRKYMDRKEFQRFLGEFADRDTFRRWEHIESIPLTGTQACELLAVANSIRAASGTKTQKTKALSWLKKKSKDANGEEGEAHQ